MDVSFLSFRYSIPTNTLIEAGAIVDGLGKREGVAGNIDATILGAVSQITNNPTGLVSALGALQHAVNVGEITQGQLSQLPALQNVLALLKL